MRRPICSIRSQSLRLIQPGPAVCGSAVFHFQLRDGVDEEEADQAVPQEGTQHLQTHLLLSSHTCLAGYPKHSCKLQLQPLGALHFILAHGPVTLPAPH